MEKRALIPHPTDINLTLVPLGGKLGVGKFAVINTIDAEAVGGFNWSLRKPRNRRTLYALSNAPRDDGTHKTLLLHRLIAARAGFGDCPEVDHRDTDGLNCTRENLRRATGGQNARNTRLYSNNTSGSKGVYWHKVTGKWMAQVTVDGAPHYLGLFADFTDADAAVKARRRVVHGDFARDA